MKQYKPTPPATRYAQRYNRYAHIKKLLSFIPDHDSFIRTGVDDIEQILPCSIEEYWHKNYKSIMLFLDNEYLDFYPVTFSCWYDVVITSIHCCYNHYWDWLRGY